MVNQEAPFVSVIVLNHNGKKFLEKCLSSIYKNTYANFEVILVDNASEDDSLKMVREKFNETKIIFNKIGLGFAGGFNKGISKAKGKLILLLSNDTWIDKNFIKEMTLFYLKNNFEVISPREANYQGKKNPIYTTRIDPLGHSVFLKGVNEKSFYLTGVSLFFNKDIYERSGGMDNDFFLYCEDVDWFWRLQLLKIPFSYADVYINHFGAGSSGGVGKKIKNSVFYFRNRNTLQMLIKNYSIGGLIIVIPFYLFQNIFEILFFLLILRPDISVTYLRSYYYIYKNLRSILVKRKAVQKERKINDLKILRNMYLGFGKLYHLKQFYGKA